MEGISGPRNPFQRFRTAAELPNRYEYMLVFPFFSRDFVLIRTTPTPLFGLALCRRVYHRGREVIQRRMNPLLVVEQEVTRQSRL